MQSALDLACSLSLALLYSLAVGFGLTLGVWAATRLQPWSVNIKINQTERQDD